MVPTLRTDLDCLDLAATGTVGASPLRAVIEHPHLTLAGVYLHDQDKVGRDAGELCGIAPMNVTATDSIDEIVELGADVPPRSENPGPTTRPRSARMFDTPPIPRVGPIDISNAVLFFASDEARYLTGATLPIDAGSCPT